MSKKLLKNIKVDTLPNGYSLKIDGNEFFYFSELDLLAGFVARIGSGNTKEMENTDLINTLFNVMLGEKYAKEIDRLNATVERLNTQYNDRIEKLAEEMRIVDEAIKQHEAFKKQLEETTKKTDVMQKGYAEALKPFQEYDKRIGKLESDTMRVESHFKVATKQADSTLELIGDKLVKIAATEKLLNSKARVLVEKLDIRMRMVDDIFGEKPSGTEAEDTEGPTETSDDDDLEVKASNSKPKKEKPAKTPKNTGSPKKNGGNTKTDRQKRDAAILAKMNENPNIK